MTKSRRDEKEIIILQKRISELRASGGNPADVEGWSAVVESLMELYRGSAKSIDNHRKRLAVTVHDLKAPITVSLLNLELMQLEEDPDELFYYTVGLRRELEFMLETIGNLLDMERMAASKMNLNRDIVSIHDIATEAVSRMSVLIRDKIDLEIVNGISDTLPSISGDHHKLVRVFNNLLSNAIKYTDEGFIRISGDINEQDRTVRISVADTGSGIDPSRIDTLFRYYNADETVSESTGIGLAFVKQIVDAHQGKIWIESTRGEGTTVSFDLPVGAME